MASWKEPPKAKIYEALSAVADGRVQLAADYAEVGSSDGAKTYRVVWTPDMTGFGSNDNASFFVGYIGYPIIAVLFQLGRLPVDPDLVGRLGNINWNQLNKRFSRDYDKAVDAALEAAALTQPEIEKIRAYVDSVFASLLALDLDRIRPPGAPPKRSS